jgi:dolichyl-phosphate-mannose--protein O-mannosyl transferase
MKIDKLKLLKLILRLGTLYFLIGAVVHYFGLTIFPWYDARLYIPYHDTLLALSSMTVALFLFVISNDPVKNRDTLNVIIVTTIIVSIVNIAIIWKVNFAALGAPDKKLQTVIEGIAGFVYVGFLLWLYPRQAKT